MSVRLVFLGMMLWHAAATAVDLPSRCAELHADPAKAALFHKHRCYVITETVAKQSWPTAARQCTDTTNGGLALWVDAHVFSWFNSTRFTRAWAWSGLFDAEALPGTKHKVKTAMYFTQSGTVDVADA